MGFGIYNSVPCQSVLQLITELLSYLLELQVFKLSYLEDLAGSCDTFPYADTISL